MPEEGCKKVKLYPLAKKKMYKAKGIQSCGTNVVAKIPPTVCHSFNLTLYDFSFVPI